MLKTDVSALDRLIRFVRDEDPLETLEVTARLVGVAATI
jgi:hypothetical protein